MNEHNIVVLRGVVPADATIRTLATGTLVAHLDVRTSDGTTTATVPLAWTDPPAGRVPAAGDEVVVLGSVRRRFFRAGGATQARTEVVVERVAPARRRADVRKLLAPALDRLAAG